MRAQFYGLKSWERDYLEPKFKDALPGVEVEYLDDLLDKDHLPTSRDAEIISIFVGSEITGSVLDAFPNLKFITTRSTGYDHINIQECASRKITVASVPAYGENTVAEFTFALILALSRKISPAADQIRETGSFSVEALQGFDLKGKTLGVVGTGRIGKHVIRMAKGFEMKVVACDAYPDQEYARLNGFEYLPLEKVLALSDLVTLHVPFMKETEHLINREKIAFMKKGAYIINTSRGGIIETTALVEALKAGQIGGAGLDVLEEEGAIKDELNLLLGHPEEHNLKIVLANHVLIDMPNVLVTPHNAFNTREALERILDTTLDNIRAFIDGHPINTVKP